MEKKRRNLRIVMILAMMLAFCFGQEAWAAAVSWDGGAGDGKWSSATNWSTDVVPTSADAVTIGAFTVTLDQDATITSLTLSTATSIITVAAGDTVNLTVNGNITMNAAAGAAIRGVANTTGRINLIIGATSVINVTGNAANGTAGLNVHNFTLNNSSVTYTGDVAIRVTGDFALTGTSSFTPTTNTNGTLVFYGGSEPIQNITVSSNSYCEFVNLTMTNSANVTTTSDFTVRELLTMAASSDNFEATAGTITFNPNAALAAVVNTGTATASVTNLKFYDVLFNCATANATPATSFIVGGDFTKIGGFNLAPTAGFIVFENADPVGKNIQVLGGTNNFYNIQIGSSPNFKTTKVKTTSDFTISGTGGNSIEVISNSSFIAEAGTITFSGAAATLVNSSTGTLKFNNFTLAAAAVDTRTASNFTIAGNMTLAGASLFRASNGTVTFENNLSKSITAPGALVNLQFFKLKVADGSTLTSAPTNGITIANNATNKTGAGIEVGTNASFTVTTGAVDFNTLLNGAASDPGASKPKTIVNNGTLSIFDLTVADNANNDVTTTSSFTVAGTAMTLSGAANGTFTATSPSTITFTNSAVIDAPSASRMYFHNIYVNNANADVTIAAAALVYMTGNLTINGAGSTFIPAADATVTFQGTSNSVIGVGSSTPATPAVKFGILVINKTGASGSDEVQMQTDVSFSQGAATALTLTDGVLNIGSKNLTLDETTLSGTGKINGGTGKIILTGTEPDMGGLMTDATFTINSVPTLYNLQVDVAATATAALDGTLTVNGTLYLNDDLTIDAQTLIIKGLVIQGAAGDFITYAAANAATTKVIFEGTGTVTPMSNLLFDDGAANFAPSLEFRRGETLTGNLTINDAGILTINSSINYLNVDVYTLSFDAAGAGAGTANVNLVSGSITNTLGTAIFNTSITTIPANLFTNNTVNNLTIYAATTLGSDLTITGTLTQTGGPFNITTNSNVLTLGPNSTVAQPFTSAAHIIGNLKQTVTSTAKTFPIGGGTAATFRPVALAFSTLGSEQVVKVSSVLTNPTLGRAGDPERAINSVWTITPEGTAPNDSLALELGWGGTQDNGLAVGANTSFAARWNSTYWRDFRNEYSLVATANFASNSELAMTASRFPIDADSLSGTWGVFVATANTTTAKDNAISNSKYKVAVLDVTPNPIRSGFPFSVTVQLQDANSNPVNVPAANGAVTVNLTTLTGTGTALTGTTVPGVIPVGSNNVTISGVSIVQAAGEFGTQIKAALPSTITGLEASPTTFLAGVSERIGILADQPTSQVNTLVLTPSTTSMTLDFTSAAAANIIIAKAGSAITDAEFPVDGTTYIASANYGQGSTIGDAVVIYKGADPAAAVTINGLAPGTTYYVRGFAYTGSNGSEKYLTFSAAGNPKSAATTGGVNDDTEYGDNDSRSLARPVGTNSAIRGTIESASDEDWFSFAVTSVSPNVRARLYDLPGNYTLELYNMDGRRIRRSTLSGTENEAMIANDLPPGTYTVRIFSQDGSYYTQSGDEYYLKVTTSSSEIFSVTP